MSETNKQLAKVPAQEPSILGMVQGVIDKGITGENVQALGQLMELYEKMQAKSAEREFAVAFVALQADIPNVTATKGVPGAGNTIRYKFAPYEDIMAKVQPMLHKHGFTLTYTSRWDETRVIVTCTLMHISGHSRSNDFAVRVGKGPPSSTESQADGSALTYAKRGALSLALNIIVDHDDDARAEGHPIDQAQSLNLQKRVREVGADEKKFLKFAGADSFAEIMSEKLPMLEELLSRKEKEKGITPHTEERDADGNFKF